MTNSETKKQWHRPELLELSIASTATGPNIRTTEGSDTNAAIHAPQDYPGLGVMESEIFYGQVFYRPS